MSPPEPMTSAVAAAHRRRPASVVHWRPLKRTALTLCAVLAAGLAQAYVAIVNKSDHAEIHVVPAPGTVTIDGELEDWDLSGAILMYLDAASKTAYAVRGCMMYDADHLYVSAQVRDPTPMLNHYAFGGEYGMSWNADAIQLRFLAVPGAQSQASNQSGGHIDPELNRCVNHITLWYSTRDNAAGYVAMYTLGFKDLTLNPPGVEGAYAVAADGKGYTLEYRVPWTVLRATRPFAGGDTAQIQWQLHWGNGQGTAVRCGMTDVRNPAGGDLGYMGPASWGTAIFHASGNLDLPKSVVLERATGHIPVPFTLEQAGKVSLAIRNAAGRLIRTCLGAQPHASGAHTYLWDGLDDRDQPVPAGSYSAQLLTHQGIKQNYVCDIGVSGTPPYQIEDGTGGWAGDYGVPQAIGIAGDAVVLGTASAEAAPYAIRADLDGRKQYGTAAHGKAVALHDGFGYFLSAGTARITKFDLQTGRLAPFTTGRPESVVALRRPDESREQWDRRCWQLHDLAVVDGKLVVSSFADDRLLLLDLASGEGRGEAELAQPIGLATAADGTLYAVSGNAVGRYELETQRFTPIAEGLDAPMQLAGDADGNLYVSLRGTTMQVWKLSPGGAVLLKFGRPGGRPALGRFDADGMLAPAGIGVDRNGRLWVAEADAMPKRYSVWNADGTLWQAFFGSIDYASRATPDPARPEDVYLQSVRYRVDYEAGSWTVDATVLRGGESNGVRFGTQGKHGGGVIAHVANRMFFWTRDGNDPTLYEQVEGRFVPRLAINRGSPAQWWLDDNNDGLVAPEEIRPGLPPVGVWLGPPMDSGLNFYGHRGVTWANQGGAATTEPYQILRWDFLGFNDQAGLIYADPTQPTIVAEDLDGGAVSNYTADDQGNVYVLVSGGSLQRGQRAQGTGHRVAAFAPDGRKRWEYHRTHCAFAWTSDAYQPGELVGALTFPSGATDDLIAVTGYYGQYFLLDKNSGLFVDALGEDQRSAYDLDQQMVLTENFNGAMFRHPRTGKTYFLGGDADQRVWELTGLETVERRQVDLVVTPEMVVQAGKNARRNSLVQRAAVSKKAAVIGRLRAAVDGNDDQWRDLQQLPICHTGNRSAQAQIGFDEDNLYLRFEVGDESPFRNTPADQRLLFKSGDAVELYLASDLAMRPVHGQNQQQMRIGDTRLIIARSPDGKLLATRYRYLTAAAAKPDSFSVETASSGRETLDEVVLWNDLPMQATVTPIGYTVEAAIPWTALGLAPHSGLALVGDVGVIYGNEGGTRNAIRYMWSDQSPEVSINNDIPSEIRSRPNAWGSWVLE